MRICLVLLARNIVSCDAGPIGSGESLSDDVEARLDVKLSIHGGMISSWDSREDSLGSKLHIFGFPSIWKIVVPVRRVGLVRS
jgi:hypothetical protein